MTKKIISMLLITLYTLNISISTIYSNSIDKALKLNTKNPSDVIKTSAESPEVSAKSAILMDIDTGEILYAKEEHAKHYPASITKILTTLIALEYDKPEDIITFSENAVFGIDRSSSNLALDVDEQISMEDSLYGVMLMSANEASAAVAEHIGGSIENFADMMNKRAKELGALNSNFKNPHGLHNPEHYTTAYDMAMISREAYKLPEFRKIISTLTYQIAPTNKQTEIRYLANQHYMYKNTNYHYDGCTGGKMGFTDQAQSTLVTFAERDDLRLVCVVLDEIGNVKYTDTISLFDYGFDNFTIQTLYASNYPKSLPVYSEEDKTLLGNTDIYVEEKTVDAIIPKGGNSKITETVNIPSELISPLEPNSVVGTLDFYCDGNLIYSTNLKNTQSFDYVTVANIVNNNSLDNRRDINILLFLIPILLLLFLLTLFICFIVVYKKRQRHRRRFYKKRW